MIRFRALLAALALSAASVEPAAAQLNFLDLPWGAPAHQVSERIRAAGYPPRGTDQWGDYVYRAPGNGWLVAMMGPAGLLAVDLEWKGEPGELPVRFAVMADSLQALYGRPAGQDETTRSWHGNAGTVELMLDPGGPDSVLALRYSSFDKIDEIFRRDSVMKAMRARGAGEPDVWRQLGERPWRGTYLDTARVTVLGSGMYLVRMREKWSFPERLDNGLRYDEMIAEVELDCAAGRSRALRTVPRYHTVASAAIETPEAERQWFQPPPESADEQAIREACAVLGRQRR